MLRIRNLGRTDRRKVGWTDRQTDHFRSPAARSLKNSIENDTIILKITPVMLDSWSMINDMNNLTRDIIHCHIFCIYHSFYILL